MHIGILQTGEAPEPLRGDGDYPDFFARLLAGHGFTFTTWRVLDGAFPPDVSHCDGWLITGSRFGAYEDHAFIPPLEQFIRAALAARVPVAGVCFGHQIMAQALGGTVQKYAGGWSVGPTEYSFEGARVALNAWHQDQVITPPPGARTVAHNPSCAHAALAYDAPDGHPLGFSVQAHPEFDDHFVNGLIQTRGRGLVPDAVLDAAQARLGQPLDRQQIAGRIADFFHAAMPERMQRKRHG
ncbi:MAG: type 1 glutamine amidotransferase [Pararhodobacter sp.]|nr:type 1 glutamine amidotransferase [Pararhodobacter sp.]